MSIVVISNEDAVPLDLLAPLLPGHRIVRAVDGLPDLADIDGLVVLGGRMSVEDVDQAPWLPDLGRLMVTAATTGVPVLAICLGAQLLGRAAGGRVDVGAAPGPERGVIEVTFTEQAATDPILGPIRDALGACVAAPSMHADAVMELPEGAVLLASSQLYPNHAFRYGSALAVQFHPEASAATLTGWVAEVGDDPEPTAAKYAGQSTSLATLTRLIAAGFVEEVDAASR